MTTPVAAAISERLEEVQALDPPARTIAAQVRNLIPRGPVKDAISGTFLGHALHPLLTDVPIGAYTSAVILDLIGGETSRPAAQRLVATGLAATPATVLTGLNDWADTEPASAAVRRTGLLHAAVNGMASAVFAASYVARRRGAHGRGRMLGLAGIGLIGAGGWLGGHLAYAQGVGVDVTVFETGGEDWTPVARESDLAEGRPICAPAGGTPVMLVRQDGRIHALSDRCAHRGGPLHEGELGDGTITCPLHGSRYALADGSVTRGPSTYPQPVYDARVREGLVEVRRRAR